MRSTASVEACRRSLGRPSTKPRRRRDDPGAHAAVEVALDALGHRVASAGRRRSASTSSPSRSARAHRCGSSSRPWSANSASCIAQNAPCSAGRLGRAGGGPRARVLGAHREVAEDDPQRPLAQPRVAARRSTGTRSRRRRRPAARRPAPRTWSAGPSGGSGARAEPLRPPASASKIRFAPGQVAGRSAPRSSTRRSPSGPMITSARCGKPPAW